MSKVWFITGTSKGFGRIWAEAALERGDRVAATARDPATLTPLVDTLRRRGPAASRSTSPTRPRSTRRSRRRTSTSAASTSSSTTPATACSATIEEVTEEQARAQIETNLFGALWVTQGRAADPARAGLRPHHPGVVDRRRQRVPDPRPLPRLEVGPRGLQPGARRRGRRASGSRSRSSSRPATRPTGPGRRPSQAEHLPAYDGVRERRARRAPATLAGRGDPEATGPAILELVDAEEPPLRIFFGSGPLDIIRARVRAADRDVGAVGRPLAPRTRPRG